jgi:26S proteasome regulatory subunit N6
VSLTNGVLNSFSFSSRDCETSQPGKILGYVIYKMASKIGEFLASDDLVGALSAVKTLPDSEDTDKAKEAYLLELAQKLAAAGMATELETLLVQIRESFVWMAKAKTAKIVRAIMDAASVIPDSLVLQVKMCEDSIQWAKDENRTFLR